MSVHAHAHGEWLQVALGRRAPEVDAAVADEGVALQDARDLVDLDAEAAQLHLRVLAPEADERAARGVAAPRARGSSRMTTLLRSRRLM
jgi:hypothetical protein